ncbi:LytTr DNA-binding domain protein [Ruminococcaceae bacterium BL-6]|jgi:DNA-binding LytR/AlgR family response regulator|nr:LytTr DNA-binding domain protein [Ruminococcaceae bacterium BL-6]
MRIALCDDDAEQRSRYSNLILSFSNQFEMKNELTVYESGDQFLFDIDGRDRYDLVFLDIHMRGTDGMAVARKLRRMGISCEIIFLTMDRTRIWEAFDVSAFHYMIKDQTSDEKFKQVFQRVIRKINFKKEESIILACAGQMRRYQIPSIEYFEATKNTMTVHCEMYEPFTFYSTLGRIEDSLKGKGFVRTHKSFLVSLRHIQELQSSELVLFNGECLPLSRKYYANVRKAFSSLYHFKALNAR